MHQTTQAWRSLPASKLRAVPLIQEMSASWTTLPRGSGLTCSSRSANRTAKKLIRVDHSGGLFARRALPSGSEEPVQVAQHRRGRAPDEVATRRAVRIVALPGDGK